MMKFPFTLLFLVISLNGLSHTTTVPLLFKYVDNDSTGITKNEAVEEHFRKNVVLMPNGIYEGYLPYVHELARSDYSNNGKYRDYISGKIPEGYMFFINLKDWSNYLETYEPSFHSNLTKYKSLSESSKEIYTEKYLTKLEELQERDRNQGVYSFERAVIVSYLKVLGSDYVYNIPYSHYMNGGEHSAGIDEDPKFRVALGEEIDFWIRLQDWKYFSDKYDLLKDIKEALDLNWKNENIDLLVDYNEKLDTEKQELERYQELTRVSVLGGPNSYRYVPALSSFSPTSLSSGKGLNFDFFGTDLE